LAEKVNWSKSSTATVSTLIGWQCRGSDLFSWSAVTQWCSSSYCIWRIWTRKWRSGLPVPRTRDHISLLNQARDKVDRVWAWGWGGVHLPVLHSMHFRPIHRNDENDIQDRNYWSTQVGENYQYQQCSLAVGIHEQGNTLQRELGMGSMLELLWFHCREIQWIRSTWNFLRHGVTVNFHATIKMSFIVLSRLLKTLVLWIHNFSWHPFHNKLSWFSVTWASNNGMPSKITLVTYSQTTWGETHNESIRCRPLTDKHH
jgi:hypothetical protein